MTRARITTQGRDWSTTSNAPGVVLHRLNQYPLVRTPTAMSPFVRDCLLMFVIGFLLTVGTAYAAGLLK